MLLCHLSNLGGGRAHAHLEAANLVHDLFGTGLASQGFPEHTVVQREGQKGRRVRAATSFSSLSPSGVMFVAISQISLQ